VVAGSGIAAHRLLLDKRRRYTNVDKRRRYTDVDKQDSTPTPTFAGRATSCWPIDTWW